MVLSLFHFFHLQDLVKISIFVNSWPLNSICCQAYHKQAMRLHPDKGGDPDDFKELQRAFEVRRFVLSVGWVFLRGQVGGRRFGTSKLELYLYMGFSKNNGTPQIIHFNKAFHCIIFTIHFGVPLFLETP